MVQESGSDVSRMERMTMKVNVKLLKKVRKLIASEPKRLEMRTWGVRRGHLLTDEYEFPKCGTVACLAGWTILAATPRKRWRNWFRVGKSLMQTLESNPRYTTVSARAAKLLGIPHNDCPFDRTRWGAPEVLAWIDRQIDAAEGH